MRNKLGIIPIKIRAKDPTAIDLSDYTTINLNSVIIEGNLLDAKGGKLIWLDVFIADQNEDAVVFNGLTSLIDEYYISVIGLSPTPEAVNIELYSFSLGVYSL